MITPEQHSIALYLNESQMYALVGQTPCYLVVGDTQLRTDMDLLWEDDGLFARMLGTTALGLFRLPRVLANIDSEAQSEPNKNFLAAYARMTSAFLNLALNGDTLFELPDYDDAAAE